MKNLIKVSSLFMLLATATVACQKPDLPDPKIEYQAPPAELMKPVERMKPL